MRHKAKFAFLSKRKAKFDLNTIRKYLYLS